MNAEKMYYNFRVTLDKFNSDISITTDDIGFFLNKAQDRIVDESFKQFQKNQIVIDLLKPLYKVGTEVDVYHPNIKVPSRFKLDRVELPKDLRYYVSSTCDIAYVVNEEDIYVEESGDKPVREVVQGKDSEIIPAIMKYIQADDIYKLLYDPFNKSQFNKVLIDINQNYLDIYTNNKSFVSAVVINYIRNPLPIQFSNDEDCNQNSELPDSIHNDLVDMAVKLFLETGNTNNNQSTN